MGLLTPKPSHSYSMTYHDCSHPTSVVEINVRSICEESIQKEETKKTYTVLQKRGHQELTGYSCTITKSEFEIYCGSFSHQKLVKPPDIEIPVEVSQQECLSLYNHQRYITSYGTTHEAKLGETIFTAGEKGVISEGNGNIYCQGEEMRVGDQIVKQILILSQYRVKVLEEKFILDRNRVEVIGDHLRLPEECTPEKGACSAGGTTYIWKYQQKCPYVKIRQLELDQTENGYLVDHHNKLVFKVEDKARFGPPCPSGGNLYYTEYSELYLTEESEFDMVKELDMSVYIRSRDDYLMWQMEQKNSQTMKSLAQETCHGKYKDVRDEVIPVAGNHFGRRSGDILFIFDCQKRVGKVASLDECYKNIPIMPKGEDKVKFVGAETKIVSDYQEAPIPCPPSAFTTSIYTEEGKWITLSPTIKLRNAPKETSLIKYDSQIHEDMAEGGLFTEEELLQWNDLIMWSTFRDSNKEYLAQGVCKNQQCNSQEYAHIPGRGLDYGMMTKKIDALTNNLWNRFYKFVEKNFVAIAMVIMGYWAIDTLITISLIAATFAKDGAPAALNFCYQIFLPTLYRHQKNRHNAMKRRRNSQTYCGVATDNLPMAPLYPSNLAGPPAHSN